MPAADTIAMVDAAMLRKIQAFACVGAKRDNVNKHVFSYPAAPKSNAPIIIPIDEDCLSAFPSSPSLEPSPSVFDIRGSERPSSGEGAIDFARRRRPIDMADYGTAVDDDETNNNCGATLQCVVLVVVSKYSCVSWTFICLGVVGQVT